MLLCFLWGFSQPCPWLLLPRSICSSAVFKQFISCLGYITGVGKTMVILIWVSQVRVQCEIFPPMATLYPLSWYYGLGWLILLYNSKKKFKSVLYDLFLTTRLPAPTTSPNLSFKVSPGVIWVFFFWLVGQISSETFSSLPYSPWVWFSFIYF